MAARNLAAYSGCCGCAARSPRPSPACRSGASTWSRWRSRPSPAPRASRCGRPSRPARRCGRRRAAAAILRDVSSPKSLRLRASVTAQPRYGRWQVAQGGLARGRDARIPEQQPAELDQRLVLRPARGAGRLYSAFMADSSVGEIVSPVMVSALAPAGRKALTLWRQSRRQPLALRSASRDPNRTHQCQRVISTKIPPKKKKKKKGRKVTKVRRRAPCRGFFFFFFFFFFFLKKKKKKKFFYAARTVSRNFSTSTFR